MNFKKGFVSLAAVIALSNTVMAGNNATYLPLSSTTADSMWVLFGVNGFSDGIEAAVSTGTSSFSAGFTPLEDTITTDYIGTEGLSNGGNLATLQALTTTGSFGTGLSIGINITGIVYDATEQVRTMYVKVNDNEPNVKIDYKASLENSVFEILLNGTAYNGVISQASTYANAPTLATGLSGAGAGATTNRSAITEVLDFDASSNPVKAKYFSYTRDLNTTGETASFYHFNSTIQQWETWQKGDTAFDFSSFEVGKAYWGRVDRKDKLGALVNDANGSTALVLGQPTSSGIPDPTRYSGQLTTGWNMVAFDDNKPFIRHAPTGLVLSGIANTQVLTFTDDSGLNAIATTAIAAGGNAQDAANINADIESAKLRGKLPKSFNLKVYRGSADGIFVVVSDKQFSVSEGVGAGTIIAETIDGGTPYLSGVKTNITNLNTQGKITSVYGEYMVAAEVLTAENAGSGEVDDNTSGNLGGYAKMTLKNSDKEESFLITTAGAGTQTLAVFTTKVNALLAADGSTNADYNATQIDFNGDGAATGDIMIITHPSKPFSVKDDTYSRVYKFANTTNQTGALSIDHTTTATATVATTDTTNILVAAKLNAAGVTGFSAVAVDSAGQDALVVTSNTNGTFGVRDAASATVDFLTPSVALANHNDINLSKGAVEGLYRVSDIARGSVNEFSITLADWSTNNADFNLSDSTIADVNLSINNRTVSSFQTGTYISTYGEFIDFLALATANINTQAAEQNLSVSATYSYTMPSDETNSTSFSATTVASDINASIIVSGVDLTAFDMNVSQTASTGGSAFSIEGAISGDNNVTVDAGAFIADLKANEWKVPNYAIYGPLYTMRDAGYDVQAILKASTEMNASTGDIVWDSVDITRDESEWFIDNEYSLFNITHENGYWVYLNTKAASALEIVSATLTSKAYSYDFSSTANTGTNTYPTKNKLETAQLSVVINGITGNAGSAYISVGGEEIQLTKGSVGNTYTANIGTFMLNSLEEKAATTAILVRAVNGKGDAVENTVIVSLDFGAPTGVVASINGLNIDITTTGTETSNFYVFKDYVPELQATRDAGIVATVAAVGSQTGSFEVCTKYAFGTTSALRIVAADGVLNASNVSDADEIKYTNTIRGADVLTNTQGTTPTAAGLTYDANCTLSVDNSASTTYNTGVSLKTLTTGVTAKLSYASIANVNFTTDLNWVANFEISTATGTSIVQLKYVSSYGGKTFFIEYSGNVYSGTFPTTQALADATISTDASDLTKITGENTTILP